MKNICVLPSEQFSTTKKTVIGGLLIAVGIILPTLLHLTGLPGGPVLLPMHIPVFLAGMLCGAPFGALVGLVLPAISTALTGMPKLFPIMPLMTIELGVYGLMSGILYTKFPKRIMVSLIGAMISGRIAYAFALIFAGNILNLQVPKLAALLTSIVTGIPGILTQLILIPIVVKLVIRHLNYNHVD